MFDFDEVVKIDPEVAAAMTDEYNRQNQNLLNKELLDAQQFHFAGIN